jgi:hypothetical protein
MCATSEHVPTDRAPTANAGGLPVLFGWLERVGFTVDIAHLRRDHPDVHWHTFADWALNQDWGIPNQAARPRARLLRGSMMGDLLGTIGDALNLAFSGRHRGSVRDWPPDAEQRGMSDRERGQAGLHGSGEHC